MIFPQELEWQPVQFNHSSRMELSIIVGGSISVDPDIQLQGSSGNLCPHLHLSTPGTPAGSVKHPYDSLTILTHPNDQYTRGPQDLRHGNSQISERCWNTVQIVSSNQLKVWEVNFKPLRRTISVWHTRKQRLVRAPLITILRKRAKVSRFEQVFQLGGK